MLSWAERQAIAERDAHYLPLPLQMGADPNSMAAHLREVVRRLRRGSAHEAVTYLTELYDRSVVPRNDLACARGCALCCAQTVVVSAAEAFAVAAQIAARADTVAALQAQWGLDRETALGTLGQGGTIDISQPLHDLASPFLRQLSISRDFVERQENCRVARIYLSGGLGQVRQWAQEVQATLGAPAVAWDPFGALVAPAVPAALDNQRGRFAAAIGAALAAFEEP